MLLTWNPENLNRIMKVNQDNMEIKSSVKALSMSITTTAPGMKDKSQRTDKDTGKESSFTKQAVYTMGNGKTEKLTDSALFTMQVEI